MLFRAASMTLYDRHENGMYGLVMELRARFPGERGSGYANVEPRSDFRTTVQHLAHHEHHRLYDTTSSGRSLVRASQELWHGRMLRRAHSSFRNNCECGAKKNPQIQQNALVVDIPDVERELLIP